MPEQQPLSANDPGIEALINNLQDGDTGILKKKPKPVPHIPNDLTDWYDHYASVFGKIEGAYAAYEAAWKVNKIDDELLRGALTDVGPSVISDFLTDHMATWSPCKACWELCHTQNLAYVYNSSQAVCLDCKKKYYRNCPECGTFVLKSIGDHHIHRNDLVASANQNVHASHDANILHHNGLHFLKADEDQIGNWSKDLRYFGVELEVEATKTGPIPPYLILMARRIFPDKFVMPLWDGSLAPARVKFCSCNNCQNNNKRGHGGFELVTLPATRLFHAGAANWHKFFEIMGPLLDPKPISAGLHIHTSVKSLSPMTIGKLQSFINAKVNREFLFKISDRDFTQPNPQTGKVYAKIVGDDEVADPVKWARKTAATVVSKRQHEPQCPKATKEGGKYLGYYWDSKYRTTVVDPWGRQIIASTEPASVWASLPCNCKVKKYAGNRDDWHYNAININTQKDTFELRIFQSSMNMLHFFAAIEFCDALLDWCNEVTIQNLNWQNLVVFVNRGRKQYPHLSEWLVEQEILEPRRRR